MEEDMPLIGWYNLIKQLGVMAARESIIIG